jgi:TRAP-type uncharacterized transport system substrate-binding protein
MKKVDSRNETVPKVKRRAARNPETRMNQLVSLAVDLVEQRLLNGTATSQETTTIIKYGTSKSKLETEMMEEQIRLMKSKREAIDSAKRSDEMYEKALAAMRAYSGMNEDDESYEDIF